MLKVNQSEHPNNYVSSAESNIFILNLFRSFSAASFPQLIKEN